MSTGDKTSPAFLFISYSQEIIIGFLPLLSLVLKDVKRFSPFPQSLNSVEVIIMFQKILNGELDDTITQIGGHRD